MKALVIGATGATGKPLVMELLKNTDYTEVVIFVRRATGIIHPKLKEYILDFNDIESYSDIIRGDIFFCCMGTTLKAAGSKMAQWRIDYEIPLEFARIAKENGIKSFVLVSSGNADSKSRFFYPRMKGELEEKIETLNFKQYIVFRPGLLNRPESDRFTENAAVSVLNFFNRLGMLKAQTPLPTPLLAQKMIKAPGILPDGISKISTEKIFTF